VHRIEWWMRLYGGDTPKRHCCLLQQPNYPREFGDKLVDIYSEMIAHKSGMPVLPETLPTAEQTFEQMVFDDLWADAHLQSVVQWLRGSQGLRIPESFRALLPPRL
ncbi:Palmitoyl-monogalactosyldiacylglycerol delta-7 desaturase, partial [Durusdinium trenchii]